MYALGSREGSVALELCPVPESNSERAVPGMEHGVLSQLPCWDLGKTPFKKMRLKNYFGRTGSLCALLNWKQGHQV